MGKFIPAPELSLDLRPIFVPKTISQFLGEVARICSVSEKILKIDDFVSRLETEIRKIDVFKRELPLCMLLMNDAIDALKEELMVLKKSAKQPVLEEFIPLNNICDDDNDDDDPTVETDNSDKKNWLSSTHLWNTNEINSDTNQNQISKQNSVEKVIQKEPEKEQYKIINDPFCGKSERDFIPYKEENNVPGLSLINPGPKNSITRNVFLTKSGANNNNNTNNNSKNNNNLVPYSITDVNSDIQISTPQSQSQPEPPQEQSSRKQRRCWSTELHKLFVNALHQLGGSKAATPKQIRELMGVDGLTNDEVKSHLQGALYF